jgi:hypothetical protein
MEAMEKTIVGVGTTPTGLVPGVMMKKQVLEYLKRTKLRRAELTTIAAELGLTKKEHSIVGKALKELQDESLIVFVQDNGSSFYRIANAGEERRPPALFDKMIEGQVQPTVAPEVEPEADLKARTCTICGFEGVDPKAVAIHAGHMHKTPTGSEYYAPKKVTPVTPEPPKEKGKKACPLCGKLCAPQGLGPHMRTHKLAQASCSTPKAPEPHEEKEKDDEEEEDTMELHPEVSELLKAFDRFASRVEKTGWRIAFDIKLSYPGAAQEVNK